MTPASIKAGLIALVLCLGLAAEAHSAEDELIRLLTTGLVTGHKLDPQTGQAMPEEKEPPELALPPLQAYDTTFAGRKRFDDQSKLREIALECSDPHLTSTAAADIVADLSEVLNARLGPGQAHLINAVPSQDALDPPQRVQIWLQGDEIVYLVVVSYSTRANLALMRAQREWWLANQPGELREFWAKELAGTTKLKAAAQSLTPAAAFSVVGVSSQAFDQALKKTTRGANGPARRLEMIRAAVAAQRLDLLQVGCDNPLTLAETLDASCDMQDGALKQRVTLMLLRSPSTMLRPCENPAADSSGMVPAVMIEPFISVIPPLLPNIQLSENWLKYSAGREKRAADMEAVMEARNAKPVAPVSTSTQPTPRSQ